MSIHSHQARLLIYCSAVGITRAWRQWVWTHVPWSQRMDSSI